MTVDQHASFRQPIDTDHAERAVLGGLLLPPEAGVDDTARNECLELSTAAFADARHRTLFRVLKELLARGPADEILVTYALQKNGHLTAAGGMALVRTDLLVAVWSCFLGPASAWRHAPPLSPTAYDGPPSETSYRIHGLHS